MQKPIIPTLIAVAALSGVAGMVYAYSDVGKCNGGSETACNALIDKGSPESLKDVVTNPYFQEKLKLRAEAKKKREADIAAAAEAVKKRRAEAAAKERKEIAAAEAKFKAEGWFEVSNGIYGRWCTQTCSTADVIGDAAYWLMEVWAKDRAAGDIYAQINVMKNGTVIGWTNDTAFLAKGQRGILTFDKYLPGSGSQYQAQLTKFTTGGDW